MSHSPVNPTTLHISSTVSTYTFYFCSAPQTSINSLFLLNVLVCSFPCPYQLLSHFITEKGVFLASPLINCAAPPLGRNESYPSFFTLHDNTLGNMLIYLFIPGLSTWVVFFSLFFFFLLVSLSTAILCSLFADVLYKHKQDLQKPMEFKYNFTWISYTENCNHKINNVSVHNCETKTKLYFGINWQRLVDIKAENSLGG